MCFSATASFGLSSVLLPLGAWCLQKAWRGDRHFLPLAAIPFAFGTQQAIEGFVWLGVGVADPTLIHTAATGFVLFSHGFWLFWIPFMVSVLDENPSMRWLWRALSLVGLCYGAYLLLPLTLHPDWLTVGVEQRSLSYGLQVLFDHPIIAYLGRMLYVVTALLPLLLTRIAFLRGFGWLVLGSLVLTAFEFPYGFISIWCYFAAIASTYVGYLFFQGVETEMEPVQMEGS